MYYQNTRTRSDIFLDTSCSRHTTSQASIHVTDHFDFYSEINVSVYVLADAEVYLILSADSATYCLVIHVPLNIAACSNFLGLIPASAQIGDYVGPQWDCVEYVDLFTTIPEQNIPCSVRCHLSWQNHANLSK